MSHVDSVKIYHMSPSCTKLLCFTLCSEETLGLSGSMIELDWTKVCHTQSMPAEESLKNTFQTEEGLPHVDFNKVGLHVKGKFEQEEGLPYAWRGGTWVAICLMPYAIYNMPYKKMEV